MLCEDVHVPHTCPGGDIHCGRGCRNSGGQDALCNGRRQPSPPSHPSGFGHVARREARRGQRELALIEVTCPK